MGDLGGRGVRDRRRGRARGPGPGPATRAPGGAGVAARPERTCVGCGRARSQGELIRFVRDGDRLRRDDEAKRLPGRGAYLCPDLDCARKAVQRRSFQRTLRGQVSIPDNLLDLISR
ncbi:MAG: YlxR family protein [Thermoleophilaceae bacterium]